MVIDKVTAGSVARTRGSTCSGNWPACSRRAASACPVAAAFASQVRAADSFAGESCAASAASAYAARGSPLAAAASKRVRARCASSPTPSPARYRVPNRYCARGSPASGSVASRPAASANCFRRSALLAGSSRSGAANFDGVAATACTAPNAPNEQTSRLANAAARAATGSCRPILRLHVYPDSPQEVGGQDAAGADDHRVVRKNQVPVLAAQQNPLLLDALDL